jgi:hypothetical protein
VRLHVGDSHHEAIGTVLGSIRADLVKNRGGSLTMRNDTVAESAWRFLGGVELSRKAKGKYGVPWSVNGQRAAGSGRPPFSCRAKTALPPQNRGPGKRTPRPNEADK